MAGLTTYKTRFKNATDTPPHPLTWQSATRCHCLWPRPHEPLASPLLLTPPEWDYLAAQFNPLYSLWPMRPPPTPCIPYNLCAHLLPPSVYHVVVSPTINSQTVPWPYLCKTFSWPCYWTRPPIQSPSKPQGLPPVPLVWVQYPLVSPLPQPPLSMLISRMLPGPP